MGKIVKHCAACDESFAEKFGFCPNCGSALQAFEMNPLTSAKPSSEASSNGASKTSVFETKTISPADTKTFTAEEKHFAPKEIAPENPVTANPVTAKVERKAEIVPENNVKTETVAVAAAAANGNGSNFHAADYGFQPIANKTFEKSDDGFHITVIEEKNVKQRNLLLLGSMIFMLSLVFGGTIYSLFNKDLLVGAIDEGNPLYIGIVEDVPMETEEIEKPKNDKDAGGGGGGGSENPEQVTKGRLPTQVEKPVNPLMMVKQMTNPDIAIRNETQGNIKRPPTNEQVGLPNGLTSDRLSGGPGSGGGFGNGTGTGAGNGRGTGEGNGIGSGSGNGNGDGNGDGRGSGRQGSGAPPPPPPVQPKPVGPTEGVKIISKPRANYTDAARQNQVQGTVTLRVTFTANGTIGSISPVSGLPYGLTEQAIAAARGIRFEPAKKGGVPYTVTKQVQYSFTIY